MPGTPPCRANQAAAAAGVGCPSRPGTSDTANPDRLAQEDLAAGTAGARPARRRSERRHEHAATEDDLAQPMLIRRANAPAGPRTSGRKTHNLVRRAMAAPADRHPPNPHWPDPAGFALLPRCAGTCCRTSASSGWLTTGGVAVTAVWRLILYGADSRSQSGRPGWRRR